MYVEASHDRVTVIFSTIFKDEDDVVIGKVGESTLARLMGDRSWD